MNYDELKINTTNAEKLIGTRWQRKKQNESYPYNGYTVLMVTNLLHEHSAHPPQVVYKGDNGKWWSLELYKWPGSLEPETEKNQQPIKQTPTIKELILCLPEECQIKILKFIDDTETLMREHGTMEIDAQYAVIRKEVKKHICSY